MVDRFSVDITLDELWLEAALKHVREGGIARVTVVITDAGPKCRYKAAVLGGGDVEYLVAAMAGDFIQEPAWRGNSNGEAKNRGS
jgi:hypothetical protein